MKVNKLVAVMGGVFMMIATHSAYAEVETSSFNVKIAVSSLCKIDTTQDVDFGTVSEAIEGDVIKNTAVRIKCNDQKPYTIALSPSNNNPMGKGQMKSAEGYAINYGLYSDAAATMQWGTESLQSHVGTGNKQNYPVYVKVDGSEFDAPSGSYHDIVTVKVNY
ncbi:Csu type fimbrial protein [Enterobacter kobei]|uniref:Csu type fimbrial protein n=1 Tax=Enterobacter kobei TaxID=208224 RepID=UPI002A81C494|nr:spore coat U domain-containing protein [Enterobacter kobei]